MPTDPKRLQIRDRIIDVLEAIVEGADYFFTPVKVFMVDVLEVQCPGYPCYSVHPDSGGSMAEEGDSNFAETFFLNVKGLVKDLEDPGAAVLKASRDVRKAIDADFASGAAGSLGTLVKGLRFTEPPVTDNGFFSAQGLGFFEQRVEITACGSYADL